jgi:hypothetical protein
MAVVRVWILYEPTIYADLFHWIFERISTVKAIRAEDTDENINDRESLQEDGRDVIIIPLDDQGPLNRHFARHSPGAKHLAFSRWEKIG